MIEFFKHRLNSFKLSMYGLAPYNKVKTHLTLIEKITLYELTRNLSGFAVEIGSYEGASSCFIAKGLSRKGGHLYCIDTWKNDAMTEGARDTFNIFQKNTRSLSQIISPKRGNSVEVAGKFTEKVEFVFFDGDHSYEGISSDWDAWKPFLAKGALVVFHDIGWAEGVQRVVKDHVKPIASKEGSLPNMYWAWI